MSKGKNKADKSDALDLNVELTRKTVGSLFDTPKKDARETRDNRESREYTEDRQDREIAVDAGAAALKKFWPEDEWSADVKPTRPTTRPVISNVASHAEAPSLYAAKKNAEANVNTDNNDDNDNDSIEANNTATQQEPAAKARPKSRFVLLDEDDEYTEFRETYKKKPIRRNSDEPTTDVNSGRPGRKTPMRPMNQKYAASVAVEDVTGDGIENVSTILRAAVIGFMLLFLILTAFLVYHNSVLGSQLEEATTMLDNVQGLEENLNRIQFELEATREELVALETENYRLASLVANPSQQTETDNYNDNDPETNQDTPQGGETAQPAEPATPANIVHTVVAGDNLSRISRQYLGDDSPESIQRIMTANNMTDPNTLSIGTQLVIPN
ncbi:MAG: LysM peptidoglycan-binding domain-containing protein [Defluviitaleaceae bacterium]|nr:LysM peptidoglycan-binding domain-containing protein [Defluviitaleaceae bacterium]